MKNDIAAIVDAVRQKNPLIHCITNYVTVNDCANILLSFGASPAMCEAFNEAYGFAQISSALYINFGTYIKEQETAAVEAVLGAKQAGIPVVIDPVGCAAIPRKIALLEHLHQLTGVDIIKGNMGEIMALAGQNAQVKGVDSADTVSGIEQAAKDVAQRYNCVVAATGQVDVITDGQRLAYTKNGVGMLKTITGAGCMVGALTAATAAVTSDMFAAACAAIMAMGIAGETAFEHAQLPGSFRVALIDSMYTLNGALMAERGKIDV